MQFLDQAKIYIRSGNGGNGCVSFRREKYIEYGGPDGGDGGNGGSVIIRCTNNQNTLIDFRYRQHFKAKNGKDGSGNNKTGYSAEPLYIDIPIGTIVLSEDKKYILCDMTKLGDKEILLKGGNGGFGNLHFKSSINSAPRKANLGQKGEEMWVWLQLKLLANIGLIGLPNAGKSSFLSKTTKATPKIADYPFTTLTPHLGTLESKTNEQIIIADIPGLIEGAHKGNGLGLRFLGHIERCEVLLHLIDITSDDIIKNYYIVRDELKKYGNKLSDKKEIIVLSKEDLVDQKELQKKLKLLKNNTKKNITSISSMEGTGLENVIERITQHRDQNNKKSLKEPIKWLP